MGTLQDYRDLLAKLESGMCPPTYRAYFTANRRPTRLTEVAWPIIVKVTREGNICKVSRTSISNPYDVWTYDFVLD